jgi:hypothetical protein
VSGTPTGWRSHSVFPLRPAAMRRQPVREALLVTGKMLSRRTQQIEQPAGQRSVVKSPEKIPELCVGWEVPVNDRVAPWWSRTLAVGTSHSFSRSGPHMRWHKGVWCAVPDSALRLIQSRLAVLGTIARSARRRLIMPPPGRTRRRACGSSVY